MLSINDYMIKYQRKIPKILFTWLILFAFIILGVILINQTFKLTDYYKTSGIVKYNKLNLLVPISELKIITDNSDIYIGSDKYTYEIDRVGYEIINEQNNFYKEVMIKVNLNDRDFIDNAVVEVRFVVEEMTIFEYIINLVRGK